MGLWAGRVYSTLNTTSLQVICLAGVEAQYSRYILNQNSSEAWAMIHEQKQNNFASKSSWVQSDPVNRFLVSLEFSYGKSLSFQAQSNLNSSRTMRLHPFCWVLFKTAMNLLKPTETEPVRFEQNQHTLRQPEVVTSFRWLSARWQDILLQHFSRPQRAPRVG